MVVRLGSATIRPRWIILCFASGAIVLAWALLAQTVTGICDGTCSDPGHEPRDLMVLGIVLLLAGLVGWGLRARSRR